MMLQLLNHVGLKFWWSWGVVEQISKRHPRGEAFEKIMLNFNFTKESHVIEKPDQKYCFKTVQKLAKCESGELVNKSIKKIIKAKSSYQMLLRQMRITWSRQRACQANTKFPRETCTLWPGPLDPREGGGRLVLRNTCLSRIHCNPFSLTFSFSHVPFLEGATRSDRYTRYTLCSLVPRNVWFLATDTFSTNS